MQFDFGGTLGFQEIEIIDEDQGISGSGEAKRPGFQRLQKEMQAGMVGAVFGLPGRATGGPVSPGRGYLVGERGPELFVPTSAGRVEPNPVQAGGRDVRVAITVTQPRGASTPVSLQRSSRQVASAVRRALTAS